jgi:succinyl-diaminopimelate desuccinylase
MIELLIKLISINSIFPDEKKIAEFLLSYLDNQGFLVKKQYISPDRFNILAEKGSGQKSYLLYAHLDTVQVYGKWQADPFSLRINGDKATGLGTADMKGGIVAILKAVENFLPVNYKLKVCFGVDEENYSEGAYKLAQTDWLNDVQGILVPESSLPAVKSLKAASTITLGRKGRVVYTIRIYGKSAHGVEPALGINAIEQGAKLIIALNEFEKTSHPELGETTFFIRRFEGKTLSLSIPDYAEIEIDFHFVCPDTSEGLKEKLILFITGLYEKNYLSAAGKKFEIEFNSRPTPFLEPFIFSKEGAFIKIATKAVEKVYGESAYNYGQSVADENIFGNMGIPTLTIGPLADNHHSAEEWVSLESLEKLTVIYREILESLDEQ